MVEGYKPKNANRKHSGWMSMRDAIAQSVNVIAVKVLVDVGFEPTIKMAKAMGIKSKLLPAYSLALGSSEVNLLEITNAYATLANKGKFIEAHAIRRIFDRKGRVIYDAHFKPKPVVDLGSVAIITWMLRGVISSGTGRPAALDRPVAGKTGTSENARDLWFIGFIPQVVAGIWLGNDDNQPTGSASATAAELWHNFMVSATKGMPVEKFPELPKLEGRKGSIKAKPVRPRSIKSGFYDPEDGSGSSSGYDGSNPSSSGGSSGSSGSDSYSSGDSGSSRSYEPAAPAPSYQAPAAPAPVNEAPAAPAAVEPAPAAPEPEPEPPPPPASAPVAPPAN
jgi:penicillin-binding protein 1A